MRVLGAGLAIKEFYAGVETALPELSENTLS